MISALAPNRTNQAFNISVLPGRTKRGGSVPNAHCSHSSFERDTKCKRDDQVAMTHRQRAPRQDQAAVRGAREGRNGALDLAGIEHVDRAQLNTERRRHGLERAPLAGPEAMAEPTPRTRKPAPPSHFGRIGRSYNADRKILRRVVKLHSPLLNSI